MVYGEKIRKDKSLENTLVRSQSAEEIQIHGIILKGSYKNIRLPVFLNLINLGATI